jgi:hypothetical protein
LSDACRNRPWRIPADSCAGIDSGGAFELVRNELKCWLKKAKNLLAFDARQLQVATTAGEISEVFSGREAVQEPHPWRGANDRAGLHRAGLLISRRLLGLQLSE